MIDQSNRAGMSRDQYNFVILIYACYLDISLL